MSNTTTKNSVKVLIAGEYYLLKSDKNPEHVEKIANYVNEQIVELSKHLTARTPAKTAVLVALNLAEEVFELKEKLSQCESSVELFDKEHTSICEEIKQHIS